MAEDLVQLLKTPWVLSQLSELSTSEMLKQLSRRGIRTDSAGLRTAYRYQAMAPLIEITGRRTDAPFSVTDIPFRASSVFIEISNAAKHGRLRTLRDSSFRRWIRFDEPKVADPRGWRNGLYYSPWQTLSAPEVSDLLATTPRNRADWTDSTKERCDRLGRIAWILTAIEPVYWPTLDPERLTISNDWDDEWSIFKSTYSASQEARRLGINLDSLASDADFLLARASRFDPTGDWSRLIRRAPSRTWKSLRGEALVAIEHRAAAEMLLKFYEAATGRTAEPTWRTERLSFRPERYMDRELGRLGISPHPGAVLIAEGETEQFTYPKVLDILGIRTDPDLIQLVCMRGSHKLTLLAAAVAGPLIGDRRGDVYELIRTPTQLVISTDPDKGWATPNEVERQRKELVRTLRNVVEAQGAAVDPEELNHLVHIHVWSGGCFEFTHFTDKQIASAIRRTEGFPPNTDTQLLLESLARARTRRYDVSAAWKEIGIKVDKLDLAHRLWPTLKRSIQLATARDDTPAPEIAMVASHAYEIAVAHSIGNFVINAAPVESG